jgi:hypothetical protein
VALATAGPLWSLNETLFVDSASAGGDGLSNRSSRGACARGHADLPRSALRLGHDGCVIEPMVRAPNPGLLTADPEPWIGWSGRLGVLDLGRALGADGSGSRVAQRDGDFVGDDP